MSSFTPILTLSPIGGLANRMRAILAADALSRHIGSALRIVWRKEPGLNARFCDLFQPLPVAEVEELSALDYFRYALPLKRNLFTPHLYQSWAFDKCLFDKELDTLLSTPERLAEGVRGKHVFISSGLGFFPTDDALFRRYFVPLPAIQAEVERRVDAFGAHTVGVHVRRTDNLQSVLQSPDEAFVRRMAAFPDATTFYLATDSEEVKATFRRHFPGRVQTSPSQADRTSLAGMQEAVAEMFTLVHTDHFLGSYYSSFSDIIIEMNGHGETVRA